MCCCYLAFVSCLFVNFVTPAASAEVCALLSVILVMRFITCVTGMAVFYNWKPWSKSHEGLLRFILEIMCSPVVLGTINIYRYSSCT